MKYHFIRQLIDLAEQFEEEYPESDTQSLPVFVAWLNQYISNQQSGNDSSSGQYTSAYETVDAVLGKMIAYVYRYARNYTKKGLENTLLVTPDDFTYLAVLFTRGSMSKMEVIEMHLQEKTTGMEIIKRLLKNGLVKQYQNPQDKRSKILEVTEKGRKVLLSVFPGMGKIATLIGGNLSSAEKMQLFYLLNKLHLFHHAIYQENRHLHPEVILQEKIPGKTS